MAEFKVGLIPEFNAILDEEKPLKPEVYIKGIDRSNLLKLASFLLGLNPHTSKFNEWREVVKMWFSDENIQFAKRIWNNCYSLEKKENMQVSLLSPIAALNFFEFIFNLPDTEVFQNKKESEVNLFKTYMFFLSNSTKKEEYSKEYIESLDVTIRPDATLINQNFSNSEFSNYDFADLLITQIIKGSLLFEFLESNVNSKNLLLAFNTSFQLSNWQEYFQYVIPLLQTYAFQKEGWQHLSVERNENFKRSCEFLDLLCLINLDTELNVDFKILRGRPLYKVEDGIYAVVYPLFVFDKIFKGLYFKFKELHENSKDLQFELKNWRRFYTTDFSEGYLLYKALDHIYESKNYKRITGKEFQENKIDGACDYYLRNGNHIFLFENKDILINAEIKHSGSFKLLENEFKKKLYYDEKEGKKIPKAILQLKNNIRSTLLLKNKLDTNYKPLNVHIYPILVLHDPSFNCIAFNSYLNYWFNSELNMLSLEGVSIKKVRPLTVINIDTLIMYADFLRLKKVSLNDLIDAYIKFGFFNGNGKYKDFEEFKSTFGKSRFSFSSFVDEYTNIGFKQVQPQLLNKISRKVFPEN